MFLIVIAAAYRVEIEYVYLSIDRIYLLIEVAVK